MKFTTTSLWHSLMLLKNGAIYYKGLNIQSRYTWTTRTLNILWLHMSSIVVKLDGVYYYLILTLSSFISKVVFKKIRYSLSMFYLAPTKRCDLRSIKMNNFRTFKSSIENINHIKLSRHVIYKRQQLKGDFFVKTI